MDKVTFKKAEIFCEANKYRFTKPRAEVLKIILSSHKPLGAYDILERLAKTINNPKPPTAYRAIDFWQEHGFVHKIESLSAYIACDADHRHQGSQFIICDNCGISIETHLCALPKEFKNSVLENAFTPSSWNLEIHGLCIKCINNKI